MVAAEKVAEKILGDLLTEVLDLVHVIHKYRVGYADLLLTSIGILSNHSESKVSSNPYEAITRCPREACLCFCRSEQTPRSIRRCCGSVLCNQQKSWSCWG